MTRNKKSKNGIGESILIEGFVEIRNGDTHIKAKNKFVQTVLINLMNFISWGNNGNTQATGLPAQNINMYLGTDTVTATLFNTAALTTPIGGAPGTAPNTLVGSTNNPSNGVFRMTVTATWNPGTVAGTVGEMAMYLNTFDGSLLAFQWSGGPSPVGARLGSRLAVADGAFAAFLINAANPLSIAWTIQISFV